MDPAGCRWLMEASVKTVMLAVGLTVAAADAHAISRYNPQGMTCAQVQAKLREEGAVILRYNSARTGVPLYGRYVYTAHDCQVGQHTEWKHVPTRDDPHCPVRECEYNDYNGSVIFRSGR